MNGGGAVDFITFIAVLMLLSYISRELEVYRISSEIELHLRLFKASRDKAASSVVRKLGELVSKMKLRVNLSELESRVNELIELVVIPVESMDPFAVVKKVKYMMLNVDKSLEGEIRRIAPNAEKSDVDTLASLVHVARSLNFLYKALNHDYTLARRFKSYWLLLQLQALLPFIAETVKSYEGALEALLRQVPIGDSVGPLVLSTLARELKAEYIDIRVPDTRVYLADLDGRRIILIKADGPGSNVGRIDEALRRALIMWGDHVSFVVTIDAMVKLEGEVSGSIVEGFGVAIGGTGAEKYEIEEVLAEYELKSYALLIKMSAEEAMMPMSKDLYNACLKARDRVKALILEHVQPGGTAVVVGVGNTLGVGN
ncbi:MAG: DUF1512 family protein [Thermofilaceae archaeon]